MMNSFRAIFRKEMLHIRRNKAILYLAVMMPLMQLTMYGFIDETVHDVPTIIVDQDRSVHSRELMDQLRATKTFAIREVTSNPRVARTGIVAGRIGVGIVIPPDYHDKRARGVPAKILVLIDGSDSIVSSGALAAVNGVISNQNLSIITENARGGMPLSAQPIILFNPEGRTANFIIPGLVAVILQMIAVMLAAGLDGIEHELPLPEPVEENLYHFTEEDLRRRNVATLPATLGEAIAELEQDDVLRDALGEHVFERLIEAQKQDWDAFRRHVSSWEIERYLQI